jgi:mannose-6-phosphate isomerase-like protein (cupin superfamily)
LTTAITGINTTDDGPLTRVGDLGSLRLKIRRPARGPQPTSEEASVDKINLSDKLSKFDEFYSPKTVTDLNDYKVAVVKAKGEFVWHKHDETDDFFLVLGGRLTIQLRDGDVHLEPGELFVVPKGVEHCPRADEEAHVLLIEPAGTPNTGDAEGALTAQEERI